MNENNALDLTMAYRRLDAACGRQHDLLRSNRQYERQLFLPAEDNVASADKAYADLLAQAKALPAPDAVYSILRSHLIDFIEAQRSTLQSTVEHPASYLAGLTNYLTFMGRKDSRAAGERVSLLLNRLQQVDGLWDSVSGLLPAAPTNRLQDVIDNCATLQLVSQQCHHQVEQDYQGASDEDLRRTQAALAELADKAGRWQQTVGRLVEARPAEAAVGSDAPLNMDRERYRMVLDQELGVSLDELLSWYDSEVDKTRAEMVEIAARVRPAGWPAIATPLAAVELMNTKAGPCDSPAEMFARLRQYLDRAQVACQQFVRLPEEHCRVVPVPEQHRLTYPWGGYGGGCPRRRPLLGEVFLNDTNYRAVSDGWIKINAVHECYPGHHVQFVRSTLDPLPETVKIGAKRVPLQEGMCHRTERLMEFLFEEDPYYPLAVAFRRHHTAVRIKADLYLMYFNRPEEDAIQLYMDELGFDRKTALGQVKSQEMQNRIGYFTCYYYGMKKLADMEARYGYDQKTFTEYLFSVLNVSLTNFERFLQLSEADKQRFLTGFPSLLQFS
ncbi:MAG: DUF885 family protein [Bacillota bacterium]